MSSKADKSLERMIFKTVDIPALPSVVVRSLALLDKKDVSIKEIEDAVSADQAFTARLLRVANSPFYGMARRVDTISGAINLIGFSAVKSLILSVSFKDLHRKSDEIDYMLWGHSIAVAAAAGHIYKRIFGFISHALNSKAGGVSEHIIHDHFEEAADEFLSLDELFVAGLMHDIGKTIINRNDSDLYKEVLALVDEEGMDFLEAERDIFGFDHCNVGGYIARKWKLPKKLEEVIEYHHVDKGHYGCNIIRAADAICWDIGIPVDKLIDFKIPYRRQLAKLSDFLQLGQVDMDQLKKDITSEYDRCLALYD